MAFWCAFTYRLAFSSIKPLSFCSSARWSHWGHCQSAQLSQILRSMVRMKYSRFQKMAEGLQLSKMHMVWFYKLSSYIGNNLYAKYFCMFLGLSTISRLFYQQLCSFRTDFCSFWNIWGLLCHWGQSWLKTRSKYQYIALI